MRQLNGVFTQVMNGKHHRVGHPFKGRYKTISVDKDAYIFELMSLVGPRPEREVFIKELETVIPYYRFRHAVKPGITGLAQAKYPYGASIEDAVWKHKYDIFYIKHQSLMLDIKILLLTVKTVLFGMGR